VSKYYYWTEIPSNRVLPSFSKIESAAMEIMASMDGTNIPIHDMAKIACDRAEALCEEIQKRQVDANMERSRRGV
jgi:hypothetical protein